MADYELAPDFDQTAVIEQLLIDYPSTRQLEIRVRTTSEYIKSNLLPLYDDLVTISEVPKTVSNAAKCQTIYKGMMLGMTAVYNSPAHKWVLGTWSDRAAALSHNQSAVTNAERYHTLVEIEKHAPWVPLSITERLYALPRRSRGYSGYFGDFRRGALFCIFGAENIVQQTNLVTFTEYMEHAGLGQDAWAEIENRLAAGQ